jgi:predicted homoserine dehydrogenase-like protein
MAGETLDAIGEFCYRGSIERAEVARGEKLVPLGLVRGMAMRRDVKRETPITWDLVDVRDESVLLQLRRAQDSTHWQ